jgi:AhpD family alkylhydroperoxidase
MASIIQPVTKQNTPPASEQILERIERELGTRYNLFTTVAHSPGALLALWGQVHALSQMKLSAKLRTGIALRVAQLSGCEYCVAANSAWGDAAGVDMVCALDFRRGVSNDSKERALLNLATKIVKDRGHHAGFEVEAARRSGATDAEIIEVLQIVSLQIFMTSLSSLSGMKIDFPLVDFQLPEKTQSEPGLKPGNQPNIPNTIETGGNESCSKEV